MSDSCEHEEDDVYSDGSDPYHDYGLVGAFFGSDDDHSMGDDDNHNHAQPSQALPSRKRRLEDVIPPAVNPEHDSEDDICSTLFGGPQKRMKLDHAAQQQSTLQPATKTVKALSSCFAEIEKPRTVSFFEVAALPTTAGLRLDGVGSVPLPIGQEQLCKLKTPLASDANTRTLAPQQWYFAHPEWNDKMRQLVQSAAMKLGIAGEDLHAVEAHLDGLILCFENGKLDNKFMSHDSHRNNDCFATLIVQLPSEFSMKNRNQPVLRVKQRHKENMHHFGADDGSCAYKTFYAAYFNDCEAVTNTHYPISQGARVCIRYRLCWRGPRNRAPVADPRKRLTADIRSTLQQWDGKGRIAMRLKHPYKEEELKNNGFGAFQPTDAARVRALKQARDDMIFFVAGLDPKYNILTEKWLSEDGTEFEFGRYLPRMNLSELCILHGKKLGSHAQEKNHNRWVVVMMKETEQFELILRDSVQGAVIWVRKKLAREPTGNFNVEVTRIVETFFNRSDGRLWQAKLTDVLRLLVNNAYYELAANFIERMASSSMGLHMFPGQTEVMIGISERNNTIAALIAATGWSDPIRSAILELMDCMQVARAEIRPYCEFMQALKDNDCVSLRDPAQREVLMCGWARLNTTQQQFAFVSAELIQIVDGMYGQDCFQEVGDRIWRNICEKLGSRRGPGTATATLVQAAWFFIRYQPTQREAFDRIYRRQSPTNRLAFLREWSDDMSASAINREAALDLLIDKLHAAEHHSGLLPITKKLLNLLNRSQFIRFMEKEFVHYDIGSYRRSPDFKKIMQKFAIQIVSHEWTGQHKAVVLKWVTCNAERDIYHGLETINFLLDLLQSQAAAANDDDEDEDIVILPSHSSDVELCERASNFDFDACLSDINQTICTYVMDKVCTDARLSHLLVRDVLQILDFMARSFDDEHDEKQQQLLLLFNIMYSAHTSQQKQQEIVSEIRKWSNKALLSKKCIQSVFLCRIVYLSALKQPRFCWSMLHDKTVTVDSREFSAFLRSEQTIFYKQGFTNITQAKKWRPCAPGGSYAYSETIKYFSVQCLAGGTGKGAFVTVTKTRDYFKNASALFVQQTAELKELLPAIYTVYSS